MEKHYQLSDEEFERQFANCTMQPDVFSHEAHLRLSWIQIRKYGVVRATENICQQIHAFDQKNGDGTKYDQVMTLKAVKLVHRLMAQHTVDNFKEFLSRHPDLKKNFRKLMTDL